MESEIDGLGLGSKLPQFEVRSYNGDPINLSEFADGGWLVVLLYSEDFTTNLPTELININQRSSEFDSLNCKVVACTNNAWLNRSEFATPTLEFPLAYDDNLWKSLDDFMVDDLDFRAVIVVDESKTVLSVSVDRRVGGLNVDHLLSQITDLSMRQSGNLEEETTKVDTTDEEEGDETDEEKLVTVSYDDDDPYDRED